MLPFEVAVVVLALLLFMPVSKLVWVLSVRRLERRLERELDDSERADQLKRARFIGALLALGFSWLFNQNLLLVMERTGGG